MYALQAAVTHGNIACCIAFAALKGPTIRKVMGGMGKKPKKNSCKAKCPKKKFMQGKTQRKKIHAQDRLHFDIKPEL